MRVNSQDRVDQKSELQDGPTRPTICGPKRRTGQNGPH